MLGAIAVVAVMFSTTLITGPPPAPRPVQTLVSVAEDPAIIAAAHHDRKDREVALNRPSRGGHMRVIARAATVPAQWRNFARCVLSRESGGSLERIQSGVGARNPGSSASGRWQFMNGDWQHSLPWMVRDRLVDFGMPKAQANKIRRYLDKRPIYKWHGYWQDIGFNEVMAQGGRHHWDGPGC